jgi:hypothetical protein
MIHKRHYHEQHRIESELSVRNREMRGSLAFIIQSQTHSYLRESDEESVRRS